MNWLLVFFGGGVGSLARYGIARWLPATELAKGQLPWATLLANVLACIVLGVGLGLASRAFLNRPLQLFLLTGFCGGFSTFSTFGGEVFFLAEEGFSTVALLYLALSLAGGVLALWLGLSIAR